MSVVSKADCDHAGACKADEGSERSIVFVLGLTACGEACNASATAQPVWLPTCPCHPTEPSAGDRLTGAGSSTAWWAQQHTVWYLEPADSAAVQQSAQ